MRFCIAHVVDNQVEERREWAQVVVGIFSLAFLYNGVFLLVLVVNRMGLMSDNFRRNLPDVFS